MPPHTAIDPDHLLRHLAADSARFRAVLADCDPAARVPACPDWDAADLLWHLAEVQWFWSAVVAGRPAGPPEDHPERPASYADLLATYDDYSGRLLAALTDADPAETAWSWAEEQTVGFTYRRQAHEALIHRLDAEQTAGAVTSLDPALAADGVHEILDVMYGGEPASWGRFEPGAGVVHIGLSDVGIDLWAQPGMFFGTDPESGANCDGPYVVLAEAPAREPEATIRGAAADLDVWLWKRGDAGVTQSGDRAVLDAFLAAVGAPVT